MTDELIGYAKITRDVSERRAADQALQESEQRFRLLVQGVHDYAIYMLDPDGMVTNWNAGAAGDQGLHRRRDRRPATSRCSTRPRIARPARRPRALATALREGKFSGEAQRMRKNGERFWASVLIDPIRDDDRPPARASPRSPATSPKSASAEEELEQLARGPGPGPEDGGDRTADRRRRPRLQQPADRDPRLGRLPAPAATCRRPSGPATSRPSPRPPSAPRPC